MSENLEFWDLNKTVFKTFFKKQFPEYKNYIDKDFDGIFVKTSGIIPKILKLFGYSGICLYKKIYFVKQSINKEKIPRLLAHELTHYIQYKRNGVLLFPLKYIINVIKKGYKKSVYEEEAKYYENIFSIWCKKENTVFNH